MAIPAGVALVCVAGCESTDRTDHEEYYYRGDALEERWHSIASPERAPDYYGLEPAPARTGEAAQ